MDIGQIEEEISAKTKEVKERIDKLGNKQKKIIGQIFNTRDNKKELISSNDQDVLMSHNRFLDKVLEILERIEKRGGIE